MCRLYVIPRFASRKQTRMLSSAALRKGRKQVLLWFRIRLGRLWAKELKLSLLSADPEIMAQKTSHRGGRLTPEQAREGQRWIRLTVLAAVLQVWMMATVVALLVPHLLALSLAFGAAYSLAAPLLFRYLNRDVERRVITSGAADGFVRFARTPGLRSSSVLSTPHR